MPGETQANIIKETPEQQRAAFIKQLKSTRLNTSKPIAMTFEE